ncbi:translation initiation factor IF-2-like isoform X2 [Sciurus carolinensis]|nr:translation initiation factor IF-2-like isoform X2 [Sciurus carolinensis]
MSPPISPIQSPALGTEDSYETCSPRTVFLEKGESTEGEKEERDEKKAAPSSTKERAGVSPGLPAPAGKTAGVQAQAMRTSAACQRTSSARTDPRRRPPSLFRRPPLRSASRGGAAVVRTNAARSFSRKRPAGLGAAGLQPGEGSPGWGAPGVPAQRPGNCGPAARACTRARAPGVPPNPAGARAGVSLFSLPRPRDKFSRHLVPRRLCFRENGSKLTRET